MHPAPPDLSPAPPPRPGAFSRLLVAGQFILLGTLAATASRPAILASLLLFAGGALGGWALAAMPRRQLRIIPEVHPRARLVRAGPYRWIRHPMYAAVLLAALGLAATRPLPSRWTLCAALAFLLALKLAREERFLRAAFPDYAAYQAASWRLVPGIW
jgi:protein-S-isoprenylcysteine O-methyltransferase Ste14